MRLFSDRAIKAIITAIVCVAATLLILWITGGLFVIANEGELYAKELNNPYVNSQFKDWNTVKIGSKSIMLPREWDLSEKNGMLQISEKGGTIATGIQTVGADVPFKTVDSFLSQILEMAVSKVEYAHTYSLLGSSFGKLYINGSQQPLGHYIKIADADGFCFFCFQNEEYTESELQGIAEAVIFSYQYG